MDFGAPWDWLAAGWQDMWAVPLISLSYGMAFSVIAYFFVFQLFQLERLSLLLPLAGGFLLLGPLLAVGLYEVSYRRELGLAFSLSEILFAGRRSRGQLAFFGVILLILFFLLDSRRFPSFHAVFWNERLATH